MTLNSGINTDSDMLERASASDSGASQVAQESSGNFAPSSSARDTVSRETSAPSTLSESSIDSILQTESTSVDAATTQQSAGGQAHKTTEITNDLKKSKKPKKKRKPQNKYVRRLNRVLPILLILSSMIIMLYPIVASQWNNYRQQVHANKYNSAISDYPSKELNEEFKRAQNYNLDLRKNVLVDPWNGEVVQDDKYYQEYLKQLDMLDSMARLRIPKIDVNLPIYHGTSQETLDHGLGHLYGTALPVGGKGTRAAITGHTGLATATMFDRLTELRVGDVFFVDVLGRTLKYRVKLIEVVLPHELDKLKPDPNLDLVTLVTCTPYGINSHRLLVTAQRETPLKLADLPSNPPKIHWIWQPWMTFMCVAIAVGVVSGFFIGLPRKRRRRATPHGAHIAPQR